VALEHVEARRERIADGLGIDAEDVAAFTRRTHGLALDVALDRLGLTYIAPFRTADMPAVDVAISHTVLEHVPPDTIRTIFSDLARRLRPDGVMLHGVDNTDHRSHKDPGLGPFDFLRYGDGAWKWLCLHPQDYTNRLRHSEYLRMAQDCGFEVIYEHRHVDASLIRHVESLPLAERFCGRPMADLATSWTQFVARPRHPGP
jgi:SAM-dependent methyltransferase